MVSSALFGIPVPVLFTRFPLEFTLAAVCAIILACGVFAVFRSRPKIHDLLAPFEDIYCTDDEEEMVDEEEEQEELEGELGEELEESGDEESIDDERDEDVQWLSEVAVEDLTDALLKPRKLHSDDAPSTSAKPRHVTMQEIDTKPRQEGYAQDTTGPAKEHEDENEEVITQHTPTTPQKPKLTAMSSAMTWSSNATVDDSSGSRNGTGTKTSTGTLDEDSSSPLTYLRNEINELRAQLLASEVGRSAEQALRQQAESEKEGLVNAVSHLCNVVKRMEDDTANLEFRLADERDVAVARASRVEAELDNVRVQLIDTDLALDATAEEAIRLRDALQNLNTAKQELEHIHDDVLITIRHELAEAHKEIIVRDAYVSSLEAKTQSLAATIDQQRREISELSDLLYAKAIELDFAQASITALRKAAAEEKATSAKLIAGIEMTAEEMELAFARESVRTLQGAVGDISRQRDEALDKISYVEQAVPAWLKDGGEGVRGVKCR